MTGPQDISDDDLAMVTGGSGPNSGKLPSKQTLSTEEDILGGIGLANLHATQGKASVTTGYSQADAKNEEADASQSEAQAAYREAAADRANEAMQTFKDNMKNVMNLISELQKCETDTMRRLTRM